MSAENPTAAEGIAEAALAAFEIAVSRERAAHERVTEAHIDVEKAAADYIDALKAVAREAAEGIEPEPWLGSLLPDGSRRGQ